MKTTSIDVVIVLVVLACGSADAIAAGPVTLTQAKANKGGVTPGDAPGFPVTISRPGSYILEGNLTLPDGDTTGIEIAASHVTLDLGGFAILGPADCSGGWPCPGAGTGSGILTPALQANVTVRNGTIQGAGGTGVSLLGDSHLVEYLHVRSNGSDGIRITASADAGSSIVQFNTVQRNYVGIYLSRGIVRHNVADGNVSAGMRLPGPGVASNNVFTRNLIGLDLGSPASFFDNSFGGNAGGSVAGRGFNMGRNLCDGAPCP